VNSAQIASNPAGPVAVWEEGENHEKSAGVAVVLIAVAQLAAAAVEAGRASHARRPDPGVARPIRFAARITAFTGSGLVASAERRLEISRKLHCHGVHLSSALASGARTPVLAVLTQPTNPSQTCTVTNGSGNVGRARVSRASASPATPPPNNQVHGRRHVVSG